MLANIVSSLGLVLNIVGVVLVWQFGLPAAISRAGYIIIDGVDEEEKAKAADTWSRSGLWLICGGFALQLLSNWL
jgi:hypothetical protein